MHCVCCSESEAVADCGEGHVTEAHRVAGEMECDEWKLSEVKRHSCLCDGGGGCCVKQTGEAANWIGRSSDSAVVRRLGWYHAVWTAPVSGPALRCWNVLDTC